MTNPPIHMAITRLDHITAIEGNLKVPIAFKTKDLLLNWFQNESIIPSKIGKFSENNALLFHGDIINFEGIRHSYTQIWVRADYKKYRSSILRYIKNQEDTTIDNDIDADHAVSKKRLLRQWDNPWVNLLVINKRINRSIGSMIERDIEPILGDYELANLAFILKLFDTTEGKLERNNLQQYFDQACDTFRLKINNTRDLSARIYAEDTLDKIASQNGLKNKILTFIL